MKDLIQIFIADDNGLLREGLVSMMEEQEDIVVIGQAPSGREALEDIKSVRPEVALIDIGMPDKDGIELTRILRQDAPEVKVIILGMIDLTDEIMQCIEAGAAGYVLKETSFDHLVKVIRSVHRGEAFCSPQMAASLFTRIAELANERMPKIPPGSVKLTARELEVITLISEGLSNKQIAQRLFIETQTVKNHVHNILDKLQLQNRLEAVQYARERNLLKKEK
ncbi:response regulator transcription factor [candidate division KSB1 bacterium]|nr:response regulator transcription factor [candidate division KSB1 bacterium]